MAPIRRYLRITRYSVLETRIYLDDPSLADSWLLNPRDPALPKVVESVRPLVLPKLREERDREQISKKNKKKAIKDVVTTDDFEVSIFLTETETRHSLLHKQKHFRSKVQTRLTSNSSKLTGSQKDAPIDLDAYEELTDVPILREESDDDDDHANLLRDVPPINETISNAPEEEEASASGSRGAKRRRGGRASSRQGGKGGSRDNAMEIDDSDEAEDEDEDGVGDGDDDGENAMFVDDSSNDDQDQDHDDEAAGRPAKRLKEHEQPAEEAAAATAQDDKKKLAMDIFYEGFAIYGRVLCLVVKRREGKGRAAARPQAIGGAAAGGGRPGGQAMMENWISSTQIPIDQGGEDAGDE